MISNSSVVPANRVDVGGSRVGGGSVVVSATSKQDVAAVQDF